MIRGFALRGIDAIPVGIEVTLERRLPRTVVIGLPPASARETIERVRSAIENSGYAYPRQRVVIDLTPSDVPHVGTCLDLAIAIAILVASGQIPEPPSATAYLGELALDGAVRPVRGSIAAARACDTLITSSACAGVAALGGPAIGIAKLGDVANLPAPATPPELSPAPENYDLSDVREIDSATFDGIIAAVASGRPLLLIGPPGCGKSMIARRIVRLLGAPTREELLGIAQIQDVAGLLDDGRLPTCKPFRAPHHSCSVAGLVGDRRGRPGEVTLAHRGVLLLDDVHEFRREALDAVHNAYRTGCVRLPWHPELAPASMPARFALVATTTLDVPPSRLDIPLLRDAVRVELCTTGEGRPWPATAELRTRVVA